MSKFIKLNGVLKTEVPDNRNYKIAQFIPKIDIIKESEFMLDFPKKNVIMDQGKFSACVGYSFILAKQILEYQHTNKWIDFDPFMLYGTRKEREYQGLGMYSFQAVNTLLHEGAFFKRDFGIEEEVPKLINIVKNWKNLHKTEVLKAKDYCISGYSEITSNNEVKVALKNKMPVCAQWPIYESFYNTMDDGIVPIPNTKCEELTGYHEMVIVGWTREHWIVVNSWGQGFGFKGMYLIPFDFKFTEAISISDTITPSKYKAREIILKINELKYYVDGNEKEFDTVPYIKNDRTYIPIRFISECLGCSIEWFDESKEAIIRSEEAIIKLKINSNKMIIDNKVKYLECSPEIINNRTMIPIRFISEALNCEVDWNNGIIIIKSL